MDIREIKKYRLRAGAYAIIENLKRFEPEEIILNLYLPIKDEKTKHLVSFFERNLVLARINPDKFYKKRYKDIMQICHWIKKNNYYKLFADFSMYVIRNINQNYNVLCAYADTLMDVWVNLAPYGYYWYGLDNNDQPMYMKELFGPYDVPMYELLEYIELMKRKNQFTDKVKKSVLEKAKKIERETNHSRINERNITNILFMMMPLINPDNEDFIFPSCDWFDHYLVYTDFPRTYKDNKFYMDMLDKRSFFLAPEGVSVQCFNTGRFFKEIRFLEQFLEDGLIVLFRITNIENKHTMGFIDLRDKFYYCLGKHATGAFNFKDEGIIIEHSGKLFSEKVLNFILEVYIHLTCDYYTKDVNSLVILSSPNEANKLHPKQIGIYCETRKEQEKEPIKKGLKSITKRLHKVKPYIRKGNASEIQRALARKYGVILPQGYTFVREHWRGKIK